MSPRRALPAGNRGRGSVLTYTWPDGAGRQYSRKAGDTLAQAEAFKRRIDDQLALGTCTPTSTMTFATYATGWIETWPLKDQTRERYRGILRRELLPQFGGYPLAKIHPHQVRAWVHEQNTGPLSASSVRQHIAVLRGCLKGAQIDGHLGDLPLLGVKMPRSYSRQPAVLTLTEAFAMIDAAPAPWRCAIATALAAEVASSTRARPRARLNRLDNACEGRSRKPRTAASDSRERPMRRSTKLAPLALALPLALPFMGVGSAWAAEGSTNANLSPVPLNGSTGSGTAMVQVNGTTIDFTLEASGLADGPHAAHIHFGADARHECPTATEDADSDNRLSTSDGAAAYGPIVVSLTKTGDTSDASGLAVDRFASGTSIQYMRGDVTVAPAVADAVTQGQAVVVVHGVAYEDERKDAMSDLDPSLPASATDPALCGILSAAPAGGAATGAGGAADQQGTVMLALGGAALIAAAGTAPLIARRVRG